MHNLLFSVIIPTCNRNNMLANCLACLAPGKQNLEAQHFEVIVSDDGTGEGAERFCKEQFPFVRYTRGPRKGPSANRNHGARLANGKWLVFTDDDCIPSQNWLKAFQDAMKDELSLSPMEGKVVPDREQQHFLEESPINLQGGLFWSCNIAISRQLFFEQGGFSESFPYAAMEDVDFRERLAAAGIKSDFVPEALVIHPWLKKSDPLRFQCKRYQSAIMLASKHPAIKKRITPYYYFNAGVFGLLATFSKAYRFRFRGFGKKVCIDLLQFYFAIHTFFRKASINQ